MICIRAEARAEAENKATEGAFFPEPELLKHDAAPQHWL
jgi:hypothetical protein